MKTISHSMSSPVYQSCKWTALKDACVTSKCYLPCILYAAIFQIGVFLAEKTQDEVRRALDWIESLCEGRFAEIFGLILTDRGGKFCDYTKIETSPDGSLRCAVYYCDPAQSNQKGSCEKNHVEFRKTLPKKRTDFDALTPWDVATINSHINSYTRKSLGGANPLALVSQVLPKNLLEGLGITLIAPDAATLTPALLSE